MRYTWLVIFMCIFCYSIHYAACICMRYMYDTVFYALYVLYTLIRVCLPTYTEYMSPEMIFNLGHDKATDVWSAGVLLYEMVMAVTPFAAKRADNMRELFTKIGAFEVCIHAYDISMHISRLYRTSHFFIFLLVLT